MFREIYTLDDPPIIKPIEEVLSLSLVIRVIDDINLRYAIPTTESRVLVHLIPGESYHV